MVPVEQRGEARSGILSHMADRRRSWKTDSQWLRLALTTAGLGVTLILASAAAWESNPVIWVGAGLAAVGTYIACAVLVMPLPLPRLLSEPGVSPRRWRASRRRTRAESATGGGQRGTLVARG